jgi:hypothetical protein
MKLNVWRNAARFVGFACAMLVAASVACAKSDTRTRDSQQSASTPPSTVTPEASTVTPQGYGAIHIGASAVQLADAVGSKIPPSHSPDERACRYVMLAALPSGMRVMLVNDSVARIDITAAGPRTADGIGIGDTEARLVSTYGARASVRPNKYTGPVGHDVVVNAPTDSTHRLIFETDGRKVVRFRAGRQPAVDLVEGCG